MDITTYFPFPIFLKCYRYTSHFRRKMDQRLTKLTDEVIKRAIENNSNYLSSMIIFFTRTFRNAYKSALNDFEQEVKIVSGQSKNNGNNMSVLYIGDNTSFEYFLDKFFDPNNRHVEPQERVMSLDTKKIVEKYKDQVDLITWEKNIAIKWQPKDGNCLISPRWVRMIYEIRPDQDRESFLNEFRKKNRSNYARVRREGFFSIISQEPEDFDLFFHRMYQPLVQDRYGDIGECCTYQYLKETLRKGRLFFSCLPDGEKVAGMFIIPYGKTIYCLVNGILDGNYDLCQLGALSSLYVLIMDYAFENDFHRIDYGGVRPLETDGVYIHKKRWGFVPEFDPWATSEWFFWVPGKSPDALDWFRNNPFLCQFSCIRGEEFEGMYSIQT